MVRLGDELHVRYVGFSSFTTGLGLFVAQPISGGAGLIAALAVTVKQRLPNEQIQVFGQPSGLTAKDVPACIVAIGGGCSLLDIGPLFLQTLLVGSEDAINTTLHSTFEVAIGGVCSLLDIGPLFLQTLLGTYFGWLYLRFLQRAADGMRGDLNDQMAFLQRGADGMRGDLNDQMAFITFFPPALQ
ncbi:hypothetical protein T484DRAFT_1795856 [Baffinella frigidus]|nr:hypothetical protein T484DRAFT_1795856 [Cryptophyta sp. CCMP2293]